jgi:hypothetical protein
MTADDLELDNAAPTVTNRNSWIQLGLDVGRVILITNYSLLEYRYFM